MPDWKKLKHALGTAARVPAQLKDVANGSAPAANQSVNTLLMALVGKGHWFPATAPAAELIVELLPKAQRKSWLLVVLAEMLGGDHVRGWLAPSKEAPPKELKGVADTLKPGLLAAARDADAEVRSSAWMALAMLPSLAAETGPLARAAAAKDADPIARAGALLALGRLGEGDAAALTLVSGVSAKEPALVRGAAALASLRLDPKQKLEPLSDAIEAWLGCPLFACVRHGVSPRVQLPWFGGQGHAWYYPNGLGAAARALVEVARHREDSAVVLSMAARLADHPLNGDASRALGQVVARLGGLSRPAEQGQQPEPEVVPVSELSPEARKTVEMLSKTMLLPLGEHGLPAAGDCRRRWFGTSPATALEREVQVKIEGKKAKLPLWRAWNQLVSTGEHGDGVPAPLDDALQGAERWQALVELSASTYGMQVDVEDLDAELKRAMPYDAAFVARAKSVADDLGRRFAAAEREESSLPRSATTTALLFLPILRSRGAFSPEWDRLVFLGSSPHTREVLEALPLERREAIAWAYLPQLPRDQMYLRSLVSRVMWFIDLVPSKRIVETIVGYLGDDDVREQFVDEDWYAEFLARLDAIAAKDASLRKIIGGLKRK